MEKSAIFHQSNSQYSYFVSDTRAVVILRTKRGDSIRSIRVLWNTGHRFCVEQMAQPMELYGSDLLADYYMAVLDNGDPGYGYIFEITDGDGGLWYYNESGFSRQMCPERAFEDNFSLVFPMRGTLSAPTGALKAGCFIRYSRNASAGARIRPIQPISIWTGIRTGPTTNILPAET